MPPLQDIRFRDFNTQSLAELLELQPAAFDGGEKAHRQLRYVEKYARDSHCTTVVVEAHYIDRDYMEDHSVFYSKSLANYENYCRRVHFFKKYGYGELYERIREILGLATTPDEFRKACNDFSNEAYLGFCVIKPLPGCPVGRTVLRCLPPETGDGPIRRFDCACKYRSHLLGLTLSIEGLAFQQQDLGVSACATTALWSALQRARRLEEMGIATPAQITIRASEYSLPFGRSLPSEGLSLDQMCQAVRSLGYSPHLYKATNFELARHIVYSAVTSGVSPVLIIRAPGAGAHAVAVTGMKTRPVVEFSPDDPAPYSEESENLIALYVHDDRHGPYLRANVKHHQDCLLLEIPLEYSTNTSEMWLLSHVLVPMHPKVRLSFPQLQTVSLDLCRRIEGLRLDALEKGTPKLGWSSWIERSPDYVARLLRETSDPGLVEDFSSSVPFSRYLAVTRVRDIDMDTLDVILDTTGTIKNLRPLAVVQVGKGKEVGRDLVNELSAYLKCADFAFYRS